MDLTRDLRALVAEACEDAVRPVLHRLTKLEEQLTALEPRLAPGAAELPPFLSAKQAAELMGWSAAHVRDLLDGGKLTRFGSPRALRVSRDELLALRAWRETGRPPESDQEMLARIEAMEARRQERERLRTARKQ